MSEPEKSEEVPAESAEKGKGLPNGGNPAKTKEVRETAAGFCPPVSLRPRTCAVPSHDSCRETDFGPLRLIKRVNSDEDADQKLGCSLKVSKE